MTPLTLQPIPYQGSKRALAPRIAKLFPKSVATLYEPFAGSAAVSVYAAYHGLAKDFVIGDSYSELIQLWEQIIESPEKLSEDYRSIWQAQFEVGQTHFNEVRARYNQARLPVHLLYLIARCVKNAVRFNRRGEFTQSVDRRRKGMHPDRLERAVMQTSSLLRGKTRLFCGDFQSCIQDARRCDLVYMDPPYHGTTYGRDKRYAKQLERDRLIEGLTDLNARGIPFVLSYDGKTGDKEYAEKLPPALSLTHIYIHAGRSSQATLMGRSEDTLESLYLAEALASKLSSIPSYESAEDCLQPRLFS